MTDAAATLPPGTPLLGREWLGFDKGGQALIRFQAQPAFTNRHGAAAHSVKKIDTASRRARRRRARGYS
ncbi:hypothetical protein [Bradyrhizobium sp. 139]|uniref:hypothetical protein n=1 Tax=Bradyrhizobium sp. 139 TaxID=2782616 RepID=UPI001FFBA059|nr:hypothetical protein [Bradyrhizobium sp. 139]